MFVNLYLNRRKNNARLNFWENQINLKVISPHNLLISNASENSSSKKISVQ